MLDRKWALAGLDRASTGLAPGLRISASRNRALADFRADFRADSKAALQAHSQAE